MRVVFVLECRGVVSSRIASVASKALVFSVGAGELLIVTGNNGSGKTSLLRIMAGLLCQDDGLVLFDDCVIYDNLPAYHSFMCYLGHKNACSAELTVRDNLEFWATLRGTLLTLGAVCHFLELSEVLDIRYDNLSVGWMRRVALARVLLSDTHIWLLDEPLANLDQRATDIVSSMISSRCEQGGMVVLALQKSDLCHFCNYRLVEL